MCQNRGARALAPAPLFSRLVSSRIAASSHEHRDESSLECLWVSAVASREVTRRDASRASCPQSRPRVSGRPRVSRRPRAPSAVRTRPATCVVTRVGLARARARRTALRGSDPGGGRAGRRRAPGAVSRPELRRGLARAAAPACGRGRESGEPSRERRSASGAERSPESAGGRGGRLRKNAHKRARGPESAKDLFQIEHSKITRRGTLLPTHGRPPGPFLQATARCCHSRARSQTADGADRASACGVARQRREGTRLREAAMEQEARGEAQRLGLARAAGQQQQQHMKEQASTVEQWHTHSCPSWPFPWPFAR